jgi:hypothetical protein
MLKTKASQVFKNTARDISDTMKRARNNKVQLANAKADMALFINVVRPLLKESDTINILMGYSKPMMVINARGLESFKTGSILQIIQVLEAFGTATRTTDYAGVINRDFNYEMPKFEVMLCAYVRDDSPTCRKVAVGTDVQTVVKYEIQCD